MKYHPYHHEKPNYFLITLITVIAFLAVYLVLLKNPKLILKTPLLDSKTKTEQYFHITTTLSPPRESLSPSMLSSSSGQVNLGLDHAFILDKELSPSFIFPDKWNVQDVNNPVYSIENNFLLIQNLDKSSFYINNLYTLSPWKFESTGDIKNQPKSPNIKNNFLYWVDQNYSLFKIQLDTQKVIWTRKLEPKEVLASHIDDEQNYFFVNEDNKGLKLTKLSSLSGKEAWSLVIPNAKNIYQMASDGPDFYVYSDQQFAKLNIESGKIQWKVPSLSEIMSPLLVTKKHITAATTDGQLYSLKRSNGEKVWEYNMESAARGKMTHTPLYDRISIMTDDGYIHSLDARTGERKWRLKIKSPASKKELLSVRLNNSAISKLSLEWGKKGWTIWTRCTPKAICIMNPKNGQFVARYTTPTEILTLPHFFKNSFSLLVKNNEDPKHPRLLFFLNP